MRPPEDVEPSALFLKLCDSRPSEVVDFPRRDRDGKPVGQLRIQVLTMDDHNRARMVAQEILKRSAKEYGLPNLERADMDSPAVREVLGDLVAHELLCMACRADTATDPEAESPTYGRVFRTADDLRRRLTADETLVLFNAYLLVQHKYGPFENTFRAEGDLEAWVKRLEEGGSAFPLLALNLPQLGELTSSLAQRICTLSGILESHWETLPDSFKSEIGTYCTGMFSAGGQLRDYTQNFTASSADITDLARRMSDSQKSARED